MQPGEPNGSGLMTPTSPPYPPYGGAAYIDPAQLAATATGGGGESGGHHHQHHHHQHHHHHHQQQHQRNAYDPNDPQSYAYVYPVSPQYYYSDYGNGYQSYPGSPALHPQSPPVNPTSPPFSPTFQYQQSQPGITLSPPTHAYMLPSQHHHFPPLHISSPVLSGTASVPGSPPHQFIQPLPGPFSLSSDRHKRNHSNHHQDHQHHQHHPHPNQPVNYHSHNIYVRGLSSTTTDESFMELCRVYGEIASSKAIIDQKTGECKGYGFAMYENPDDCHAAIDGLNKAGLQASFARVGQESFSSKLRSLQDESSTNIYISNLPLDMTEQKLEDLFHPHKTISNRILRDPVSGMSRGVGFARMADRDSAVAIIEKFNGQTVMGSSAPLQVRFADSPAQKKLKNQTARKRMFRPRDFQPMAAAGFPVRPMMPITPETMLGIAPNPAGGMPVYYPDHPQFAHYPAPLTAAPTEIESADVQKSHDGLASPPDDETNELAAAVEQKLAVKDSIPVEQQ
ncbi:hypothetical protein BCR43DRAFT_333044 [Syncephalastrum racemosum]|uniref:RRM domain-containing protein n=1 Tax=Syncephalastrum racemosum TaxID=13706 RepID=A0A1X2H8B1_SYNRA|nr:hypothetical protein BCR43DRAFT_333044 [Syncephalastrum racemosum]